MKKSSVIVSVVGIAAVGAIAFYGLKGTAPTATAQAKSYDTVTVAVASRAIDTGDFVLARDIEWKAVSTVDAPQGYFVRSDKNQVSLDGALLKRQLKAGETLQADELILRDDPEFLSAVLRSGMRAFTIQVDNVTGGAGLLRPGNRVDVILSGKFGIGAPGTQAFRSAQTLLTNVRVIAVDKTIDARGFRTAEETQKGQRPVAGTKGTVTLEVTPKAAEILTVARNAGELSLSLRNLADSQEPTAVASNSGVTTVAEIVPIPVPKVVPKAPEIKTYYGAESQETAP
ncbi:MAG: Flp pilus assembly protein CpaB [Sutterellaceae bacterium]|nr:Flp pilus assembly protein CpaB [Sutterellaceae bacterium]